MGSTAKIRHRRQRRQRRARAALPPLLAVLNAREALASRPPWLGAVRERFALQAEAESRAGFERLEMSLAAMKERREIRDAMLGPRPSPPPPLRRWPLGEAASLYLGPGRVALRCESHARDDSRVPWPRGPWDTEPDVLEWRSPETPGLGLLLCRNQFGAWCGYVALPPEHPLYGAGTSTADSRLGSGPHGGVTYGDFAYGNIFVTELYGEPAWPWLLGFDCAHLFDLVPALDALAYLHSVPEFEELFPPPKIRSLSYRRQDHYRDLLWVRDDVEEFALVLFVMGRESRERVARGERRGTLARLSMQHRALRRERLRFRRQKMARFFRLLEKYPWG